MTRWTTDYIGPGYAKQGSNLRETKEFYRSRINFSSTQVYVPVQREMENWRSPLASIPPSSAGQLGEHRATQVATAELRRLKLQLVSRKKNTLDKSAIMAILWSL